MPDFDYAGFWIRCVATFIDCVFFIFLFQLPILIIYGEELWTGDKFLYGFWDAFFTYVLPFTLTIWLWLRYLGTPGKILSHLKVVDASTGENMSVGQAICRYFAYFISLIPFGIGFLWIAFDDKKQGWHDKLAKTVVIKEN
jgi:uncharacterized RDD family membrane protein YckC